ncbi:MAG: HDIG domain-containing metalloprotein [Myxococcota bacterium]
MTALLERIRTLGGNTSRRLARRLHLDEAALTRADLARIVLFVALCVALALLVVDYARAPEDALQPGDIATHTVKAPFTFTYVDHQAHDRAMDEARDAELAVFVHNASVLDQRIDAIREAFRAGRTGLAGVTDRPLPPDRRKDLVRSFLEPLRVQLRDADVAALLDAGFPPAAEQRAEELLNRAMRDHLIVVSRDQLPQDRRPIRIIHLAPDGGRVEEVVSDFQGILVPEEARQRVSLGMIELNGPSSQSNDGAERAPALEAASELARALVTANLQFDALETDERRATASNGVQLGLETIKRGQILFRAGEVVTPSHIEVYGELQARQGEHDWGMEVLALGLFFGLLFAVLYHFGSTWLGGITSRFRDLATVSGLLVLTAMFARGTVASAESISTIIGFEAEPRSVWFIVPVSGAAMLVRMLLGVSWSLLFTLASSVVCGLVMDQQALPIAFFLISGVAGASAVEQARERIAVIRAGAVVGVIGAIAVLLIHLVQLFVVEGELSLASTMRPFWSMTFAFAGGIASAFLALGLVPVFEWVGFDTDYRMMELANLNHPLLRQLMLRAPGSYHHSVIVGTLAEAGAAAIGANPLLAKVASYFHDIGKSLKPQYFVENQRGGLNKHQALDPFTSAHVIVSHVIDGGRMAREHALPQPIIDNIYMHHGTGILQYFYAEACAQAGDPSAIDEAAFRYPGPKPNTREAGVIMLADKVEAATRTLKNPDEHNIRQMIGRIVSSVITDGQFSECPLTFEEIHKISDTFVAVLVGIYHQRIEYPQTADVSRAAAGGATPTLELATQTGHPAATRPQSGQGGGAEPAPETPAVLGAELDPDDDTDVVDYESLDYLPRRE